MAKSNTSSDNSSNKQRRGKKDTTTTTTTSTNSAGETETTNSVDVQIQKAQEAIQRSRLTTAELHSQWRLHLLRLSYMVVLLSLHQWSDPITNCLKDAKSYNESLTPLDDDSLKISGLHVIALIVKDSFCEILSFIMSIMLLLFLNQQYKESSVSAIMASSQFQRDSSFTNIYYMIATGLLPAMFNLYMVKKNYITSSSTTSTISTEQPSSCLDESTIIPNLSSNDVWERHATGAGSTSRSFPVVVLFHVIATGCCWFMDMQQTQHNKNVQKLENLQKELSQAREETKIKKKS